MNDPAPPSPAQRGKSADGCVVFKKYGNRRLYDTNASRYVTLAEIENMVQSGTDVQVLDAKSHDDITKEILVQIILERDSAKAILPTSFLKQVVRMQASPLKESFTRTLQDSLDGFLQTQRTLLDAQRALLTGAMHNMQAAMPQATGFGSNVLSQLNPFAAFAPANTFSTNYQAPQPRDAATEVDKLREEVAETQALLRQFLEREKSAERRDAVDPKRKK